MIASDCSFKKIVSTNIANIISKDLCKENKKITLVKFEEINYIYSLLSAQGKLNTYGDIAVIMDKHLFSSKLLSVMADSNGLGLNIDNDRKILTLSANVPTISDTNKTFQK